MTLAGVLLGLLAGAGLLLVLRGLTPPNPHPGAALTRLDPNADPSYRRPAGSWRERVGLAAERNLAGRPGFTTPSMDLELIRNIGNDPEHAKYTVRWYWAEKASSALAGFVIPLVLALLNRVMGSPFPDVVPVFFSLVGAVYFWFLPDAQIKRRARQARADFGRAAVAYLQLVAIHRRAGGTAAGAMRDAATISDSWMFTRILEEITRATMAGTLVWDAMTRLGDRTGISELREVGDIMRLAGKSGAGVAENLLTRARGLRDRILSHEQADAIKKTTAMNLPIVLTVTLIALTAAIPAVAALLKA